MTIEQIVTWADLEPQPGQWRFETLDRYVELARERNIEVLLPLGMSPTWASARPGEVSSYGAGATAEPGGGGEAPWPAHVFPPT